MSKLSQNHFIDYTRIRPVSYTHLTVKNLADDITVIRDESGITEKLLADIADYSA